MLGGRPGLGGVHELYICQYVDGLGQGLGLGREDLDQLVLLINVKPGKGKHVPGQGQGGFLSSSFNILSPVQ